MVPLCHAAALADLRLEVVTDGGEGEEAPPDAVIEPPAVQCSAVQGSAVQCSAVQCSAVPACLTVGCEV
jgi:hypothetical protein